jgi:chromosome segregation ATPase
MGQNDQITFQVKTSAEGKSRVYLKSWEDADGTATLASVIAKDFRLRAGGEGLSDAFLKLDELDKKYEKAATFTNKEAKAAHKRMDHAFPSLDSRMTTIEEWLGGVTGSIEALKQQLTDIHDSVIKVEKNVAELNYDTDQLKETIHACETGNKTSDLLLEKLESDIAVMKDEVIDLRKFNDKVVLFYSEDDVV